MFKFDLAGEQGNGKKSQVDNPISLKGKQISALNEARAIFIKSIDIYVESNPSKIEEINELKRLVEMAYLQRKATLLLKNRFNHLNDYLESALRFALKDEKADKYKGTRLFRG